MLKLNVALLAALVAACSPVVEAPELASRPLFKPSVETAHVERARLWLEAQGLDVERLITLPESERAAVANTATYRFCENGTMGEPNLLALYDVCSTQCGGYTHVFRGLAEALELKSRPVRLWNIPQQGSHVAAEVLIDGDWAFFDPTFGAHFADGDRILSFKEIAASQPAALGDMVRQASKGPVDKAEADEYSAAFDHPYMRIENYALAEAVTHGDKSETLALQVPIVQKEGGGVLGDLDAETRDDLSRAWLNYTNATINDDDPDNDTAFAAATLQNWDERRELVLQISGLETGKAYRVEIVAHAAATKWQIVVVETRSGDVPYQVCCGVSRLGIDFIASGASETFRIRNASGSLVEAFAFSVHAAQANVLD